MKKNLVIVLETIIHLNIIPLGFHIKKEFNIFHAFNDCLITIIFLIH